jgi:hypothetical protein
VDILEFQEKIIIPFLEQLESGLFKCFFYPTQTVETFIGSLNFVIGTSLFSGSVFSVLSL